MKFSNNREKNALFKCIYTFRRKFSIIYRNIVKLFFHIYLGVSARNCIVVKIKNPTLANYLYSVIGIAWICNKKNINLKFVFPDELKPLFENTHINKSTPCETNSNQKIFYIDSISSYLASTGRRAARKDISAEYGHGVISQLSIGKEIQHQADEWLNTHIKGDWVAVHYRGTDMYTHPRFAERLMTMDAYTTYLKAVLDDRCSIFVCSDQAQFIDKVQTVFPNRVYYREIRRSTDTKTLHLRQDNRYGNEEAYRQKCDALIDVLIASKARLIYTTGSQFIDISRYFNPNIGIISLNRNWEKRSAPNYLPIPQKALLETLRTKQSDNFHQYLNPD